MKLPISEQELVSHVEREYQLGYNVVVKKRQQFRIQDALINGTSDPDKIDLKTIYYVVQAMMAMYYSDSISVKFAPRKFGADKQAKNLTALAKFDYDEMDKALLDYQIQWNRLVRGVGLAIQIGYDKVRQVPKWQSVDTRCWIPDPRGWFDPKDFRFHGFELSARKEELTEDFGYDQERVKSLGNLESPENILTRTYEQRAANLNPNSEKGEGVYDVYHHYTIIEGRKYLVSLGDQRRTVIRCEEIEPTTKEEKKNPDLVPFPVVTWYFSPQHGNPYGNSIIDLLQDKHRYKNIMANLMFIREKDSALGDDVLYDTNVIKNRNDLATPTLGKKFIGVDGSMGPIGGAVAVIPKNPNNQSTYAFNEYLDRTIEMASSVDARQLGVSGSQNTTLGEAQQLQANNNLKTIFNNRINARGEKFFWQLWYRCYRENFTSSAEKVVRVTNSFGSTNVEFKKDDFLTDEDPDVSVMTKSEYVAIRDEQRQNLTPLLLSVMNNPNKPAISKAMAERKLYDLSEVPEDEALVYAPPSYEEMDAMQKLELINNQDMLGAQIDNMEVDHLTYILVFERAIDSPVKWAAIEARKQAIIAMGQNKQQVDMQQSQQMNAMASSQMMNDSQQSRHNATEVQSRATVAQ